MWSVIVVSTLPASTTTLPRSPTCLDTHTHTHTQTKHYNSLTSPFTSQSTTTTTGHSQKFQLWSLGTEEQQHLSIPGLCSGLPRWASTRMVNQCGFIEARDSEWQWHQLGCHVQVCTLQQTDNHANTFITLSVLQARCTSCHTTSSVKALQVTGTEETKQHQRTQWQQCCTPKTHNMPNLG